MPIWTSSSLTSVGPTNSPREHHHALAMANLVEDSTLDDGWETKNRGTESSGAGHTATASVFWNLRGAGQLLSKQYGWGYRPVRQVEPYGILGGSQSGQLVTMGARAAVPITLASRVQLRLGAGVGANVVTGNWGQVAYQSVGTDTGTSIGLNVFADVDLVFGLSRSLTLMVGYSFITQPVGGDGSTYAMSWGPASCIHAGIEFGR